jgi:hypothetical protein
LVQHLQMTRVVCLYSMFQPLSVYLFNVSNISSPLMLVLVNVPTTALLVGISCPCRDFNMQSIRPILIIGVIEHWPSTEVCVSDAASLVRTQFQSWSVGGFLAMTS